MQEVCVSRFFFKKNNNLKGFLKKGILEFAFEEKEKKLKAWAPSAGQIEILRYVS